VRSHLGLGQGGRQRFVAVRRGRFEKVRTRGALGHAEIRDNGKAELVFVPRPAFGLLHVQEDVARLEVAVQDAALVGVVDGVGERGQEPGGFSRRRPAVGSRQPMRQAATLDELHAQVRMAGVGADLVDGQDVGVVEVGGGLGLGAEALQVGRGRPRAGQQHLEGDDATQAFLPRLVDDAHAAARDLVEHLVIAEVAELARPGRQQVAQRGGEAVEVVLVGEEGGQVVGQLGVFVEQFFPAGGGSVLERTQVAGQHLVQTLFAFPLRLRRHGGFSTGALQQGPEVLQPAPQQAGHRRLGAAEQGGDLGDGGVVQVVHLHGAALVLR